MEKYIDTITQIKAAVEEWFRKTVGNGEGVEQKTAVKCLWCWNGC
jgi:hypothetical protein